MNRVKLVHKVLLAALMITWQVKIDVILLFTCSIVIEHKFAAGQLHLLIKIPTHGILIKYVIPV